MNNSNCCCGIFKLKNERMGTCFREFNTVLFKQKLLQLVLWNKYAPLKKQGYSGFLPISIPFKFSPIKHRPLAMMDGCNKCCKINTESLTCGSL